MATTKQSRRRKRHQRDATNNILGQRLAHLYQVMAAWERNSYSCEDLSPAHLRPILNSQMTIVQLRVNEFLDGILGKQVHFANYRAWLGSNPEQHTNPSTPIQGDVYISCSCYLESLEQSIKTLTTLAERFGFHLIAVGNNQFILR